jgi:hypothetical protein
MGNGGLPTGLWVIIVAAVVMVFAIAGIVIALSLLAMF